VLAEKIAGGRADNRSSQQLLLQFSERPSYIDWIVNADPRGREVIFCSTGVADCKPRGALTRTVGLISPWFKGRAVLSRSRLLERRSGSD
jgi:hypothetical protein